MATIGITSVTVRTDGWSADVILTGQAGQAGNEVYDYGFGIDNDPADAKVVFTLTSEGYDATGTLGTIERTVYGTQTVRKPYPDDSDLDEIDSGGNLSIRMALSDFIYDDDVSVTVTITSGWITNGANSTILNTDIAVTNSSTFDYPRVTGNWAWPGFERASGDHIVECVAFHRFAQDGKPVACVKFDAVDESAHNAATQTVTDLTISSRGDPTTVLVYTATIPVTALDTGEAITVDFTAYPWVGDADSILDTGDAANTAPSPLYTSTTFFCDKAGTFGQTVAYVDGVGAGSPAANDIANDATAKANPFATIAAAVNGIVAYNTSEYSRANSEAGIVKLEEGSYEWTGDVNTPGTNANTWLTITKADDASRSAVIIDDEGGDADAGARVKIENISFVVPGPVTTLIDGVEQCWIHNCTIDDVSTAFNYSSIPSFMYYTMNTIVRLQQGFRPNGNTRNTSINLVRGNTVTDSTNEATVPYVVLGNTGFFNFIGLGTSAMPTLDNGIIAYNNIKTFDTAALFALFSGANTGICLHGFSFIQNIVERTGGTAVLISLAADGSVQHANNVLMWYNTTIGQRVNLAYNDTGSNPYNKLNWSIKNNLLSEHNIKTDTSPTADGGRVGNWPVVYGVTQTSNYYRARTTPIKTEFFGLYNKKETGTTPANIAFVLDASLDGTDNGGGDYHLTASSIKAIGRSKDILLPYDIEGSVRFIDSTENGGAVGAYEFGTEPTESTGGIRGRYKGGYRTSYRSRYN